MRRWPLANNGCSDLQPCARSGACQVFLVLYLPPDRPLIMQTDAKVSPIPSCNSIGTAVVTSVVQGLNNDLGNPRDVPRSWTNMSK